MALLGMLCISPLCVSPLAGAVDLVRVEKSARKLFLLQQGKVVREFNMVLGSNPVGHKQQEGDGKTPEGVYWLDFKKPDSAYYKSIHVSYPNAQDLAAARKLGVSAGGQIMLHGQPNGLGLMSALTQQRDWTAGCIALSNADMEVVWQAVRVPMRIEILP